MKLSVKRITLVSTAAIVFTAALCCEAAINPADPGLADARAFGESSIANNGSSALCVECHTTRIAPMGGNHFAMNNTTGELRTTNSGGGWEDGYWGVRDGGEFFKITQWTEELGGSGGYSRYGSADDWTAAVFAESGEEPIASEICFKESNPQAMAEREIICESCHNIRLNVEGRYNLLSRVLDSEIIDERVEGKVADLCVGCHGFLYHDDAGLANSLHQNWNDFRNTSALTGGRRANNERHYISGQRYPRNHHVMTGDTIDLPVVEAGLMMRDVKIMDVNLVSNPIRTDSRKGTIPMRMVPVLPMVLATAPTSLHCVTCHAPAHGGDPTMGAAILVGQGLRGLDIGFGVDRIYDGKNWGRYNDLGFCTQCHE